MKAITVLSVGVVVALWIGLAYKLRDLRRDPQNLPLRSLCLLLLGMALSFTIGLPPIALSIDRLTGMQFARNPIQHIVGLIAIYGLVSMFMHLVYREDAWRHIRPRLCLLTATTVALLALFWLVQPWGPPPRLGETFVSLHGAQPFGTEYLLVLLAAAAFLLTDIVRLAWRYAQLARRASLSAGLRILAAGSVVGIGFCVHKGLYVLAARAGWSLPTNETIISALLSLSSVSLIFIGVTLPSWGPRLAAAYRWPGLALRHRRLKPLWRAVCVHANPQVVLAPEGERARRLAAGASIDVRLSRRVVEIRDGILALRPYMSAEAGAVAEVRARDAGLAESDVQAVADAARIAVGLRAKTVDRPADGQPLDLTSGGQDLDSEVTTLTRTARALRGSPIIASIVAEFAPDRDTPQPNAGAGG